MEEAEELNKMKRNVKTEHKNRVGYYTKGRARTPSTQENSISINKPPPQQQKAAAEAAQRTV